MLKIATLYTVRVFLGYTLEKGTYQKVLVKIIKLICLKVYSTVKNWLFELLILFYLSDQQFREKPNFRKLIWKVGRLASPGLQIA